MFKHLESRGSAVRALGVSQHTTQQQTGFLKHAMLKSLQKWQKAWHFVYLIKFKVRLSGSGKFSYSSYFESEKLHKKIRCSNTSFKKKKEKENSDILNKYGKPQHKVLWYIKILNLQLLNPPLRWIHPLHTYKTQSPSTFYCTHVQERKTLKIDSENSPSHNESIIQVAVNITG